jgi:glycosyltransferase 2 family protein
MQQKPSQKPAKRTPQAAKIALSILVVAVAVVFLLRHGATVRASLHAAAGASMGWLGLSLLGMALTFCIAAAIYGVLAFHRLRYLQTVGVELATAVVNRLLPWGLGGLGLHGIYLYKRGHTGAESTVVVSVNNLLGIVANIALIGGVVVLRPGTLHGFLKHPSVIDWRLGLLVLLLVAVLAAIPPVRIWTAQFLHNMSVSLRKVRPGKLAGALVLAMLLTATYTTVLYTVSRSLGLQLDILQTFIVFSFGMLTSTATPTPGGLVGAEAGLFAGFTAYGVPAAAAGAAVLLYRFITYWLPLAPGTVALVLARRKQLV